MTVVTESGNAFAVLPFHIFIILASLPRTEIIVFHPKVFCVLKCLKWEHCCHNKLLFWALKCILLFMNRTCSQQVHEATILIWGSQPNKKLWFDYVTTKTNRYLPVQTFIFIFTATINQIFFYFVVRACVFISTSHRSSQSKWGSPV